MISGTKGFQVDLAFYRSIQDWKAQVGDTLICHNFFTHWFGIVSQINQDNTVVVTRAGLPSLLLTMNNNKQEKSKLTLDIADIINAKGGKYAAIKCIQNQTVWFI
jgi:hypothetical protein